MGSFGFLTAYDPKHYRSAIDGVFAGGFRCTPRMRIACRVTDAQATFAEEYHVLNDFALHHGPTSMLLRDVDCFVNDELLTTIDGDGIVVATPSGSTAYSSSCGGSMVRARCGAATTQNELIASRRRCIRPFRVSGFTFVCTGYTHTHTHRSLTIIRAALLLTPISPRSLSFRPILLPKDSTVRFQWSSNGYAYVPAHTLVAIQSSHWLVYCLGTAAIAKRRAPISTAIDTFTTSIANTL